MSDPVCSADSHKKIVRDRPPNAQFRARIDCLILCKFRKHRIHGMCYSDQISLILKQYHYIKKYNYANLKTKKEDFF